MEASAPRAVALMVGAWLAGAATVAFAHVSVWPIEAPVGRVERYRVVVPSEKPVPATRVEVQFPVELHVTEIEAVAGWRATSQRDRAGRIIAAVWQGGEVPSGQFVELGVLARNPDRAAELSWKIIQTHQDGSEIHWTGPPGTAFPAAMTRVRRSDWTAAIALIALMVALLAAAGATLAWRRRLP